MVKNLILFFLFSLTSVMGQGFTYTYTDPCTLKPKEININNPNGNISLIYNGVIESFTPDQIINGSVEEWINGINSNNPLGPCSGTGLSLNTNVNAILTQNNIAVLTSVMSIMDNLTSFGGSSLQGIIETEEKISSKNEEESENKPKNIGNGQTNNNQAQGNGNSTGNSNQTNQSGNNGNTKGDKTKQEGETNGGRGNSESGNGGNNNQSNNTGEKQVEGDIDEKVDEMFNDNARNTSTVSRRTSSVRQGSLIMNGDVVTISSATGTEAQQVRVNMGIISSNTKNTFAKGVLVNYTSSINNTNVTLFASHKKKNFTKILANSSMLNFEGDFFNTTSTMFSYQHKQVTLTGGVNYTFGNLGESKFSSLSTLGGAHTSFKLNRKMRTTVMMVIVYSPYIYYYQDMWHQSGILVVPFTSTDYSLTKTFKLNISFSGVQQVKDQALNYQILIGAKALL
jgi:hypothetical protein